MLQKSRFELRCGRCQKKEGSCIQCDYKTCTSSFHVRCAIRANRIEMWDTMLDKIGNPENTETIPVFCAKHEGVGNLKFKIDGVKGIKVDQKNKKEGTWNTN